MAGSLYNSCQMAEFTLPKPTITYSNSPQLEEAPEGIADTLRRLRGKAVAGATKLLDQRLGDLAGPDLELESLELSLDYKLGEDEDLVVQRWEREIARAIALKLPQVTLGREVPGHLRGLLGPLIVNGTGPIPDQKLLEQIAWELPREDVKAFAAYLRETKNRELFEHFRLGYEARKRDQEQLEGLGKDFDKSVREGMAAHLGERFRPDSVGAAYSFPVMAMRFAGQSLTPYARARLLDAGLTAYAIKLLGQQEAAQPLDFLRKASAPRDERVKVLEREIPDLNLSPVLPRRQVEDRGQQASQLQAQSAGGTNPQAHQAALAKISDLCELDQYRAVLHWRAQLGVERWTSFEIERGEERKNPLYHDGILLNDTYLFSDPSCTTKAFIRTKNGQKDVFMRANPRPNKRQHVDVQREVGSGYEVVADVTGFGRVRGFVPAALLFTARDRAHTAVPNAPLFQQVEGEVRIGSEDVVQGSLGTCYFLAAIASIARNRPEKIREMFHEHSDGSISVRFYQKTIEFDDEGDEQLRFDERWVRVSRSVVTGYTSSGKDRNFIWAAIAEKAYAAFKTDSYGGVAGGWIAEAMQAVLGVGSVQNPLERHMPFDEKESEAELRQIPDLPAKDVQRILAYRARDKWKQEWKDMLKDRPHERTELAYTIKHAKKAGLSPQGRKAIEAFYGEWLELPLGTVSDEGLRVYSAKALELWDRIENHYLAGGLVGIDTVSWGRGGTGQSGGENTSVVPGLASTHAYEVIGLRSEDDGSRFVVLRNPWGKLGRVYKESVPSWWKRLFGAKPAPIGQATEESGQAFSLDLGDLMRYGWNVHYGDIA